MNTIFLLHGAPGSGKSTFIRDHALEEVTVSRDETRKLVSGVRPCLSDFDGEQGMTLHSPWRVEKAVTSILDEVIRGRMTLGQVIVVDGTHIDASAQAPYVTLAQENGYRIVVVDFQSAVTEQELLQRNRKREVINQVPEKVITSMCQRAAGRNHHQDATVITPEEFESYVTIPTVDHTGDKIVVIGDVQGVDSVLDALGTDADAVYVFAGDLFDRGPDNAKVAKRLLAMDPSRRIIVRGNHDEHVLRGILHGTDVIPRGTQRTFAQFAAEGVDLNALKEMLLDATFAYSFTSAGHEYLVTHGGVMDPGQKVGGGYRTIYPCVYYTYGTGRHSVTYQGRGDYSYDIDTEWDALQRTLPEDQRVHQMHGHRNEIGRRVDEFTYSTNLEHNVDSGGGMGVALIEGTDLTRLVIPS